MSVDDDDDAAAAFTGRYHNCIGSYTGRKTGQAAMVDLALLKQT